MRARLLILLAILPLLSACGVVQSKNPLSSPRTAIPDKRIEGLWNGDKSKTYVFISNPPHGDGSIMMFQKNDAGAISTAQYKFFVTRTPNHTYVNLSNGVTSDESTFQTPAPGTYWFAEYRINWLGQLIFRMVAGDDFAKAIDAGKLKGRVERDQKGNVTAIYLTDTSQHIRDFIESARPSDVFQAPAKLNRIGYP